MIHRQFARKQLDDNDADDDATRTQVSRRSRAILGDTATTNYVTTFDDEHEIQSKCEPRDRKRPQAADEFERRGAPAARGAA